jgi:hypothetical protein
MPVAALNSSFYLAAQVPGGRIEQGLLCDLLSSPPCSNSKWTSLQQLWQGPCRQNLHQQRLLSSGPAASSGAGASSAAGTSSSSASSARPASRLNTIAGLASRSPGAAAAAASGSAGAGASGAAAAVSPAGWLAGHREAVAAIPMAPKLLGFAGKTATLQLPVSYWKRATARSCESSHGFTWNVQIFMHRQRSVL